MGSSRDIDNIRRAWFNRETSEGAFYAQVKECDETARTCVVEAESVTYDGVSLFAVENPKLKGPCIIPAVGSTVLVGRIGGSNELYIAMFSQIDKVLLTIGDDFVLEIGSQGIGIKADTTTIQASTGGLTFSRGSSSLKKTLTDLCDALGALTVPTGTGPSGVPINKAQFDLIKQGLNDYLEA